jgi:hypothetical protein
VKILPQGVNLVYNTKMKNVINKILGTLAVIKTCDSVTCQNEGTCVVEAGLAVCYCKGDYSGATCSG